MELEDRLKSLARFNLTRGRDIAPPREKDRIEKLLNGVVKQNRFGEFILVRKEFDPCGLHPGIKLFPSPAIKGVFLYRICSPKNQCLGARGLGLGASRNPQPPAPSYFLI